MRNRLTMLAGAAIALWGCSSEAMLPAPYVGVPGAGIKAQVVGLVPEPDGYLFKVNTTNLDAVALELDNPGCDWGVDRLVNGNWVSLFHTSGDCLLYAALLQPGQSFPQTFQINSPGLPTGTQLRVTTGGHTTSPITLY